MCCKSVPKMFAKVRQKCLQKFSKNVCKSAPKIFAKVRQNVCKSAPKCLQKSAKKNCFAKVRRKCWEKCAKNLCKSAPKRCFLSPELGKRGFTYLQVVPAFIGAKQVMTRDIIKCTFIPFPGLQIKRAILSTCLCFQRILSYPFQKNHEVRKRHGLRTPNEGINQRYLKNWADVADKICFGRT